MTEFREPTGHTPITRGFHPKGQTTLIFKQRLKTQTLVQKDTVSSAALLKATTTKTVLWPVVWAAHTVTLAARRCSRQLPGPGGVSVRPSGKGRCRDDTCLLRRNHSAGLWRVVSRRGWGRLQSGAGSSGWGCREKELSQREQVLFQLKYIHDGIVQLSEHHEVDGKAGGAVLGGRIAREPGERVVLLQNKP